VNVVNGLVGTVTVCTTLGTMAGQLSSHPILDIPCLVDCENVLRCNLFVISSVMIVHTCIISLSGNV